MIVHIVFLDHVSLTNEWHDKKYLTDQKDHICDVVGFLEKENDKYFYISTMRGGEDIGSCHMILKSTVISVTKYPKKSK
jgi:hypothetical protein